MKRLLIAVAVVLMAGTAGAAKLDVTCPMQDNGNVSISIDDQGDWSITHNLASGIVVRREVQYEIYTRSLYPSDTKWEGSLKRKPTLRMVGNLTRTGGGWYSYNESLYDDGKGSKKVNDTTFTGCSDKQAPKPAEVTRVPDVLPPSTASTGAQAPDSVKVREIANGIEITSLANSLKITSIDVNRGQCESKPWARTPVTLNFGETLRAYVSGVCIPIEVSVSTSLGLSVNKNFDSTPIKVERTNSDRFLPSTPLLIITGTTDSVTIKKVTINRGNCDATQRVSDGSGVKGSSLKFGQRYLLLTLDCKVIEAAIETDNNSFDVTFP